MGAGRRSQHDPVRVRGAEGVPRGRPKLTWACFGTMRSPSSTPRPTGDRHDPGAQGPARPSGDARRAEGLRVERRRLVGERDRHDHRSRGRARSTSAPNPHGLAMSPDGKLVLVSAWGANQAVFLDTAADRIVGRVPVAQAHNGAISADGRSAWVGSQQQGATALVRIDVPAMKESGPRSARPDAPRARPQPRRPPALLHGGRAWPPSACSTRLPARSRRRSRSALRRTRHRSPPTVAWPWCRARARASSGSSTPRRRRSRRPSRSARCRTG